MKQFIFLFASLFLFHKPLLAQDDIKHTLIPAPVDISYGAGSFLLTSTTRLVLDGDDSGHKRLIDVFAERLRKPTGFKLPVVYGRVRRQDLQFSLIDQKDKVIGEEGYILSITPKQISILANTPQGWFYAFETLMQLLPAQVEQARADLRDWRLPSVRIKDFPAYQWRGLMLDVSRHFFPKEVIKSYIGQMAKYKLNTFHFHLTDNQGWRLEVKDLPKLTAVGAWRVPRTGYWKGFKAPQPGERATDGGFYSEQDIKEIIGFAQERFVTVVPEIDVPGHSLALIASYPELSCDKKPQQVLAGDPWNISRTNVLCVGNDSTYQFLDKLFTNVARQFPSEYIHIGGDEVTRSYWKQCAVCQKRMKDEGMESVEELQAYFIKRVTAIVQSKGKKVMGWYENLGAASDTSYAVISWKDMKGGTSASQAGHKVVMAPAQHTYLDFYQNDPVLENGPFSVARLTSFYNFDLLQEGANPSNVLGGEGCLWTEQIANERKLQQMTWPRAMALSEVFWSPARVRNWNSFTERVEGHFPRLDSARVKYSTAMYEPIITAVKEQAELKVKLDTEVKGVDVYYTFDDTDPDNFYPKYDGSAIAIPAGAHHIRVVSFRNGRQVGRIINLPITELNSRIRKGN